MSGLPGKMATLVAGTVMKKGVYTRSMELFKGALTGPDQQDSFLLNGSFEMRLKSPEEHESFLSDAREGNPIIVDYTQPDVVNRNVELYCKLGIPFVMGTTGGDRSALEGIVKDSGNTAVIAPNMAKPIVAFQAMMKYAADTFPDAFKEYSLDITESHQSTKKDTSGTAKAMVEYFNQLGIPFTKDSIRMIREPEAQRGARIPKEHLNGHGWHTYTLKSGDGNVLLKFTHNVNGRQVYADGTIDAIKFLYKNLDNPLSKGSTYSMIDVLSEGN